VDFGWAGYLAVGAAVSRANDMAFPVNDTVLTPNNTVQNGLTIREHFAAMAMQGLLAGQHFRDSGEMCAESAVAFADALIAELAKAKP
jgi:hypothetical protein